MIDSCSRFKLKLLYCSIKNKEADKESKYMRRVVVLFLLSSLYTGLSAQQFDSVHIYAISMKSSYYIISEWIKI